MNFNESMFFRCLLIFAVRGSFSEACEGVVHAILERENADCLDQHTPTDDSSVFTAAFNISNISCFGLKHFHKHSKDSRDLRLPPLLK